MSAHIAENAARIRERVALAAERSGRVADDITIVAVSKTFDRESIDAAYDVGFRVFAESRVQEISAKFEQPLPTDAELHMIGPLQTNKIRPLLTHITMLETLDREKLGSALQTELEKQDRHLKVLLQINVSGEDQKSGVSPEEASALLESILQAPRLQVSGLMTMAPLGADEKALRHVFGGLRNLRDQLAQEFSIHLPVLSMGMSDDFETAIAEGATHVRIGRAIFGTR